MGDLGPGQRDELTLTHGEAVAAFADGGLEPHWHPREPVVEAELHEDVLDVSVGGVEATDAHVLADGGVEEESVLGNEADRPATGRAGHAAHVLIAHDDRATGRIGEPAEQRRKRRLARAGLADDRDVGPGGDVDRDVGEDLRAGAVGEVHVLGAHRQRTAREFAAVRVVGHIDRDVEDVEDLAPPGDRGLGLVDDLADLGDGEQQQVHEERERHDGPEVESELHAGERGEGDDRGERERSEHVTDGEHHGEVAARLAVGEVEALDASVQPIPRPVLEAVRPHGRGAGDGLGELAEHVAGADPDLVVRHELAALEESQDRDDRQERDDRDDRELPGVDRHHHERADHEC